MYYPLVAQRVVRLDLSCLRASGVPGPDAGFALATAGLGSAVVLNLILWVGLIASIPGQGVNAAYGSAAACGRHFDVGGNRTCCWIDRWTRSSPERSIKWIATKLRMNPDNAADVLRQLGFRLQGLAREPGLKERVFVWALLNWLLDMAALWVFLPLGAHVDLRGLIVAFGLANIMAVVPITPGGLGIVEGIFYSDTRWFWFNAKCRDCWSVELPHRAILDAAHCWCNCVFEFACWAMGH